MSILFAHHVGSTAIPSISAKPRLDIDNIIDKTDALPLMIPKLEELGYYSQRSLETEDGKVLGRRDDMAPYDGKPTLWMKQNMYICLKNSSYLQEHILFRDYLRAHPIVAKQYEDIKQGLVKKYRNDQDAYVQGKSVIILRSRRLAGWHGDRRPYGVVCGKSRQYRSHGNDWHTLPSP
jgi:GrpB-like predicted nucleotidyltransferase (UPF0157 family)